MQNITRVYEILLSKPERFFLIIALLFGLPILIFRPAYDIPDFKTQLEKSYAISEGKLIPQFLSGVLNSTGYRYVGSFEPKGISELGETLVPQELGGIIKVSAKNSFALYSRQNDLKPVAVSYNTIAAYNPLSYIPQAISFMIGRILNLPFYGAILLASIINFTIWLLMIRKAIKIAPLGKWLIVGLNLLPMTLFLVPSISSDPLLFGVIFMFAAYLLKFCQQKNLSFRIILPLILLCFALALFKETYFILIFASLALYRNFINRKQAVISLLACILPALAMIVTWLILNAHLNYIAPWSDPHFQAHFLLSHPQSVLKDVLRTLTLGSNGLIWSFFGILGLLILPIPLWCLMLLMVALVLAILIPPQENKNKKSVTFLRSQTAIISCVLVLNVILIIGALYIYWTAPGDTTVEGLQGRYFIPIVILAVPILRDFKLAPGSVKKAIIALQAILIICLISSWYILAKFYYSGILKP